MRCLVLMPFRRDFDAVFACVRATATHALDGSPIECSWLKDAHAAGRITDQILDAIQDSTLCIADVTGDNPNVMWETGYAMALGRPTILIGQSIETIPFDLRTHRVLPYALDRLEDLSAPLAESIRQTLARYDGSRVGDRPGNVFWLGHDLARAIRLAMYEPENQVELTRNLLFALHHLDQIRLKSPAARRLLLDALALARKDSSLSPEQRKELWIAVASAKNELGDIISQAQQGFRGHPTLEETRRLELAAGDAGETSVPSENATHSTRLQAD